MQFLDTYLGKLKPTLPSCFEKLTDYELNFIDKLEKELIMKHLGNSVVSVDDISSPYTPMPEGLIFKWFGY